MLMDSVRRFLSAKNIFHPFFIVVGDREYSAYKSELLNASFKQVRLSDFCSNDDSLPDLDECLNRISNIAQKDSIDKIIVTGLGEYLALRGKLFAERELSKLKLLNTGKQKVVLLLRGIALEVKELMSSDERFLSNQCYLSEDTSCNLSITICFTDIDESIPYGLKSLLIRSEEGDVSDITVSTSVMFAESLFNIKIIKNAYEYISWLYPSLSLMYTYGNDDQWLHFLKDIKRSENTIDKVFDLYFNQKSLEADFDFKISTDAYTEWVMFIALKYKAKTLSNSYLRYALESTNTFEDFKSNLINAITNVEHSDNRFMQLYSDRKTILKKFHGSDIANFVLNNRIHNAESIYRLTDTTKSEREEIISWIVQYGFINEITEIYPALAKYLNNFVFNCGEISDLLTNYFNEYRRQKVTNIIEPPFASKVDELATSRIFNRLPTRSELLDKVEKSETHLYWLDALGVEYLSYITDLACHKKLSISIGIARAELPTITSINNKFYAEWQGPTKEKNSKLDDVKHNDDGGYNFEKNVLPIHLVSELDIIDEVLEKAATMLNSKRCKKFLIVSDHGASRLAVLRKKEEKYHTGTKGEHSGRCCKVFEPYDLPFAAEENGYIVLADYGRFKGSRAANVEVHGGASLEEVVIPIIELTLKEFNVSVKINDNVPIIADYRTGTEVILYIDYSLSDVSIIINDKRYIAEQISSNNYSVRLPDINRAGDYQADVYHADNYLETVRFKAQSKSGKINTNFDELF